MNKKTIIGAVIVLIAIGAFFWWRSAKAPTTISEPFDELASITTITAEHFWKDGVHTLEGRLTLPTPCHTLKTNALVAESYPEQVTVQFIVSKIGDVCTQVVNEKMFSVSFKASKDAKISAQLNGRNVILDLAEQGSVMGEAIDKL